MLALTGQVEHASADKGYDAVLTIDANKHIPPNFVTLEIGMSFYSGAWNDDQKLFFIMGDYSGPIENNQIVGWGSQRVLIKTIAKKPEPKPEPMPTPKPQQESKPAPTPQPKPKQESKPVQQLVQKEQVQPTKQTPAKTESKPKQPNNTTTQP